VLAKRPTLRSGALPYLRAYQELQPVRAESGGIPFSEIESWARLNRWDHSPELVNRLLRVVRNLDAVFIERRMANLRSATPPSPRGEG